MQFEGAELTGILRRQTEAVQIHDRIGRTVDVQTPGAAVLTAATGTCVGVGNERRIRFLRPMTTSWGLNSGSQTTRPMRADGTGKYYGSGQLLGNPHTLREHRLN
jgi:hypothetical protein